MDNNKILRNISAHSFQEFIPVLNKILEASLNLQKASGTIVPLLVDIFQVQRCSLMFLEDKHLFIAMASWNDFKPVPNFRIPLGEGIAGLVAQHKKPLYSTDTKNNLGNKSIEISARYPNKTFCSVPIVLHNRCLGVLNISNKTNNEPVTDNDFALVQLLASTAGHVIQNALFVCDLEHHKKMSSRILNSLPIGVLFLSENGKILFNNAESEKLLEITSSINAPYEQVLPHGLTDMIRRYFLDNNEPSLIEEINVKIREKIKPLQTGIFPIREKDRLEAVMISLRDLSLSYEYERLKKIDDMRINFVSMISHELRTPLTCIKGSIPVLQKRILNSPENISHKMLDIIDRNSNQLMRLINNLLDISLIQKDSLQIASQRFDPLKVIEEIQEELKYTLTKKSVTMQIKAGKVPSLYADRDKIKKAWYNIVENGVKFSPKKGEVYVKCTYNKKEGSLLFSVKDKGEGIAPENYTKVFNLFWQEDNSRTREYGGSGIGLYIAKNIILGHNGKIWFEPNKTKGMTFYTKLFVS